MCLSVNRSYLIGRAETPPPIHYTTILNCNNRSAVHICHSHCKPPPLSSHSSNHSQSFIYCGTHVVLVIRIHYFLFVFHDHILHLLNLLVFCPLIRLLKLHAVYDSDNTVLIFVVSLRSYNTTGYTWDHSRLYRDLCD